MGLAGWRSFAAALAATEEVGAVTDQPPRIRQFVDVLTSEAPGDSSGRRVVIDHVNPRDAEGKPPAIQHELIELHPGTVVDTFAIPQCTASDPELLLRGPAACPKGSIVGSGEIQVDTGIPGPFRIVVNDITLINAPNELIFSTRSRGTPVPIPFVVRETVAGNTFQLRFPALPGTPPDGGAPTLEMLHFQNRSSVRNGRRRSYITTPPSCPASGHWTNRIRFTFRDGVAQTYADKSPCQRRRARDDKPPRIRIRGVPGSRCASRDIRVRVRIFERWSGLLRARMSLDGRRLRQTRRKRFSARIDVRRLRPGRHRVRVVAVDRAGNRRARAARFRRCR